MTQAGTYVLFAVAGPTGLVSGTARSPASAPLAGVTVRVDGLPWGAVTRTSGTYALLGRPGTVIVIDNVVRAGEILAPAEQDAAARATLDMLEVMGARPELDTAAIQTVGAKGWDGFALALVKRRQRRYAERSAE